MEIHRFNFLTSHHQFYVVDKVSPFRTDAENFWTNEASDDKLAVEEGLLGVGIESYGTAKGDLQVFEFANDEIDFNTYDHIVEGSLTLRSGVLQIFGCLDETPILELLLPPEIYRVRIYAANLDSVKYDNGDDYYKIRMWPGEYKNREVLKR